MPFLRGTQFVFYSLFNWRNIVYFNPACVPCIINQAYRASKLFTNGDRNLQLKILKETCEKAKIINEVFTAPHFSAVIQDIVERNVNSTNLYKSVKESNLKIVEDFLPILDSLMKDTEDKFSMAVRVAIAGNTIDVGANPNFDLRREIKKIVTKNVNRNNIEQLKEDVNKAKKILYIGDNFEETVFDKFLLKELADRD